MARQVSERLLAALLLLLGAIAPALAADRAVLDIIGYSADGKLFAFEEYGIQDGSGFAYSTLYVIDLTRDAWVGSPIRVQAEDEATPLAEIRAKSRAAAAPALDAEGIAVPAETLVLVGIGADAQAGRQVEWVSPACCGPADLFDQRLVLRLDTLPIGSNEDWCREEKPVGFSLELEADGTEQIIHLDEGTLPLSRGCTLDYRIHAVVKPLEAAGGPDLAPRRVALISAYRYGFEGVDRRFLAVPIDR